MAGAPRRLHFGCGDLAAPGWVNCDRLAGPGVDVRADIRAGLPFADGAFRYAVAIHAVQALSYLEVTPALRELRRVLAPGGVLRLGLPDLDRALAAYRRGDAGYFYVPDAESATVAGKFSIQMTWYGANRTLFTADFADELLRRAGFAAVARCAYRATASRFPAIVALDNRERESLFIEATAPRGAADGEADPRTGRMSPSPPGLPNPR